MERREPIVDTPAATTAGPLAQVDTVLALNAGERIDYVGEYLHEVSTRPTRAVARPNAS